MSIDRDPIKRRAKPSLLLLDEDFHIAFSEPSALELIAAVCGQRHPGKRLPASVEQSVRSVVASASGPDDLERHLIVPVPSLLVRVSLVSGSGGSFIALLL